MKTKCLPEYINLLSLARAEGESRYPAEITYNGYSTVETYRLMVLEKEVHVGYEIFLLLRLCRQQQRVKQLVESWVWELETMLSVFQPENRHKSLTITWDGREISPTELPSKALDKLDSYLLIQRKSFLRQRNFLLGDKGIVLSDYSLDLKLMEQAELLCLLYYTGIVKSHDRICKKDFIRFFCATWNLPVSRNIDDLMRQVMQRENPTAFLDRLKSRLLEYIERKYLL